MKLRRTLLRNSRLYLIIDNNAAAGRHSLCSLAAKARRLAGVDIVQFRAKAADRNYVIKNALLLRKAFLKAGKLFIVNDYVDVAKIINSDGVHLGQEDMPIDMARRVLGEDKIIGISCHSLRDALEAQDKGADYIGIGPVFPTATKPEYKAIGPGYLRMIKARIKIPFFAIGGINLGNISTVLLSGAKRVSVCSAILQAKNMPLAVRDFSQVLH